MKVNMSDYESYDDVEACIDADERELQKLKEKKRKSKSKRIVELAANIEMFPTKDGRIFAKVNDKVGFRVIAADTKEYRDYLAGVYYDATNDVAADSNIKDALAVLATKAKSNPIRDVYHRLARYGEDLIIDIGSPDRKVYRVSKNGWSIEDSPVLFRRPSNMLALPLADKSKANFDILHNFINVEDQDFVLVKGFICQCFMTDGHYLIGVINGMQGSAKSTLCRTIKLFTDPFVENLTRFKKDELELGRLCFNEHVLAFDNISRITKDQSDMLCTVCTGGSIKNRQLYSDAEQIVQSVRNPVLLNGINDFITAHDLTDRVLTIKAPPIEGGWFDPKQLEHDLASNSAAIMAGILDQLVLCEQAPQGKSGFRMSGSANYLAAIPGFTARFTTNVQDAKLLNLDNSIILPCLQALLVEKNDRYEVTPTKMLADLTQIGNRYGYDIESRYRTVNSLGMALAEESADYHLVGINMEKPRNNKSRNYVFTKTPVEKIVDKQLSDDKDIILTNEEFLAVVNSTD